MGGHSPGQNPPRKSGQSEGRRVGLLSSLLSINAHETCGSDSFAASPPNSIHVPSPRAHAAARSSSGGHDISRSETPLDPVGPSGESATRVRGATRTQERRRSAEKAPANSLSARPGGRCQSWEPAFPFGEHPFQPLHVDVVEGERIRADDRQCFFHRRPRAIERPRLEHDLRTARQHVRFARG